MTTHLAFLVVSLIPAEEPAGLGERIVAYAESRLGERVGDGQCTGLVAEALEAAGAERLLLGDDAGRGEPVGSVFDLRPGDILAFEDAAFVRRRAYPSGAARTTTMTMGHHVAIVEAVRRGPGTIRLAILHQNAGPEGRRRQVVQRWVIDPAELVRGTMLAYRPVANESRPEITEDVIERTKRFEGVVPHLYLDTEGLVTVGVGHRLNSPEEAIALAFEKESGGAATEAEERAEYEAVKKLPPGRLPSDYEERTELRLPQGQIDTLLNEDLAEFERQLRAEFAAYDTFPQPAKEGLLDMAFNLGVRGIAIKFPMFTQAVREKDWSKAAAESRRSGVSEERNEAIRELFEEAAGQ